MNQQTTTLISKTNKNIKEVTIIALLLLCINVLYDNGKVNVLTNWSNMFLYATILMTICMKIFAFNITLEMIRNNVDVNDTVVWAVGMIYLNLVIGTLLSAANVMISTFIIECYMLYACVFLHLLLYVKNLVITFNETENKNPIDYTLTEIVIDCGYKEKID